MADEFKESDLFGARAKDPKSGIRDMDALGQRATPTQREAPVIDDPVQLFKESAKTGVKNLQANNDLFRGAVASLMGNEVAAENLVNQAQINQVGGATYLNNVESFEQFLDQPTFGGFINQAISATGQFLPSAVASIGTAMTGAAVGALAGATAPLTLGALAAGATRASAGLVTQGLTKKEATNLINKYIARKSKEAAKKNPKFKDTVLPPDLTPDEKELVETLFRKIRQDAFIKRGAIAGAFGQEYPQGAGIAFGNYAEEDMTDPVAAFKSLAGYGPAFASIGVLSEAAVANSVAKVLKAKPDKVSKEAAKEIEGLSFGGKVGLVTGTSAVSETVAEGLQEELSIQQKFNIDEDYTQAQAELDRYQAYFNGFFGGIGIGGGIGTVSAAGSNLLTPETVSKVNTTTQNVATKSKELLKKAYEDLANRQADESKMDGATPGQVVAEPDGWLQAQFTMLLDPASNKKAVWVDKDTPLDPAEFSKNFPNAKDTILVSQASPLGTLYSLDPNVIENYERSIQDNPSDNTLVDQFLVEALGYTKTKGQNDGYVVEIRDASGNLAWYQQTDLDGIQNAQNAAKRVLGGAQGYTIEVQSIEDHFSSRVDNTQDVQTDFMTLSEEITELSNNQDADPVTLLTYNTLIQKARQGGGLEALSEEERTNLRDAYRELIALDAEPTSPLGTPRFGEELAPESTFEFSGEQEALGDVVEDAFLGSKTKPILNVSKKDFQFAESKKEGTPGVGWVEASKQKPKAKDSTFVGPPTLEETFNLEGTVRDLIPSNSKLGADMEKALDEGKYSDSLLKAYVRLHEGEFSQKLFSDQAPLLAIVPTAKNAEGKQTYGIVRLKTIPGDSTTLSGLEVKRAVRLASRKESALIQKARQENKQYKPTGWKIQQPGVNKQGEPFKPVPVYMPDLVGLGMSLRIAEGEKDATPTNIAGLALNGFSEIYGRLTEAGYKFTTTGNSNNAVVYRTGKAPLIVEETTQSPQEQAAGVAPAKDYTLKDLRSRRNEVYFNTDVDTKNKQVQELESKIQKIIAAPKGSPIKNQFTKTVAELKEARAELNTLIDADKELVRRQERAPNPLMEQRMEFAQGAADTTVTRTEEGDTIVEIGDPTQVEPDTESIAAFESYNLYELGTRKRATDSKPQKFGVKLSDTFSPSIKNILPEQTLKDLTAITSTFKRLFNIDKGIVVIDSSEQIEDNQALKDIQFSNQSGSGTFVKYVQEAQEEVANNPDKPAAVVQTRDGAVIILDALFNADIQNATDLNESFYKTYTHELGHILLDQERYNSLKNPRTASMLYAAFEKEAQDTQEPAYLDPAFGFDEWYADKTAASFFNKTRAPSLARTKAEREANRVTFYFNRLVNKLKKLHKAVNDIFANRFKKNTVFDNYVEEVIKSYRGIGGSQNRIGMARPNAKDAVTINYMEQAINENLKHIASEESLRKIQNQVKAAIQSGKRPQLLQRALFTAHGILSNLGKAKGTGKKMADILYSQSSTTDHRGLLNVKTTTVERYLNQLQKALGDEKLTEVTEKEINMFIAHELLNDLGVSNEVLLEAAKNNGQFQTESGETVRLSELGVDPAIAQNIVDLRKFYKRFYDEQDLASLGVSEREYYSTVSYDIPAIYNSAFLQNALIQALIVANKDVTFERPALDKNGKEIKGKTEKYTIDTKEATATVVGMLQRASGVVELGVKTDGFHYGLARNRAEHFKRVKPSMLRSVVDPSINAGLLKSPDVAALEYITSHVKRSEYNKRGGPQAMQALFDELPSEERQTALDAFNAMIGRVPSINNTMFRNLNSAGVVFNTVTLLGLSTFASFPDLGGSVLRTREFKTAISGIGKVLSQLMLEGKEGREEAGELIRALGVAGTEGIASYYINAGESDFLGKGAKNITQKFFRYIGLEHFTRFTRVVASIMARHFLDVHAKRASQGDQRSIRYLRQLQVTPEQYFSWRKLPKQQQLAFETAEGIAVRDALTQFVEESVIRPNAAERPMYGSDPRFALVFQLKGFFYAYGKNIVGGTFREMSDRYKEGEGINQASIPLILAGLTLLPLTALGFDLRERFKVGLDYLLPFTGPDADTGFFESSGKNYRRSLNMGYGEYSFELLDRSGFLGPVGLALPLFMQSKRYGDPFFVSPLGPSFEKIYQFGSGDLNFRDVIPIYSNL